MNILIAATNSQMFSGATRCLVDHVEALHRNGHEVIVVLPRPGDLEEQLRKLGIKYYLVHEYHAWYTSEKHKENKFLFKRILNYKSVFKICYLIKKHHIDIVHVNALTSYTSAKAAIFTKTKLVWHMREFMEEDLGISFHDINYSKSLINKANVLIAISEAVRNKWESVFDSPIRVIPDGLPAELYYQPISRKNNTPLNVLIYGRIVPGKGQFFFFKGVEKLLREFPDLPPTHFYWAGKIEDTDYYSQITHFISHSSFLIDNVTYLGEVNNVRELLSDKHIVTVCSSMEAFGRVTVEAMLSGLLVLGANSAGTASILNDEKYGFLYDVNDLTSFVKKLYLCLKNYDNFFELRKNAQEVGLKKYSLEKNYLTIVSLYENILKG